MWLARTALAGAVAAGIAAAGSAVAGTGDHPAGGAHGPGPATVVVDIEHSAFEPADLRVVAGTRLRFVVVNHDPIPHELIVGPPAVHDRHREGTEPWHPPRPGEVSVAPHERATTTYTFDEPGTVEMVCHLPGHADFGMRGEIEVVPR